MQRILGKAVRTIAAVVVGALAFCAEVRAEGFTKVPGATVAAVPGVEAKSSWTGAWIGGALSYGWQTSDAAFFGNFDARGVGGGIDAGVDGQIAGTSLVLGAYCHYDFFDISGEFADIKRSWFCGGRAGVLVSTSALVYATLGYTQVDGGSFKPTDDSLKGLTFGGGLEMLVAKHWSLKGEYTYTDLGSTDAGMLDIEHSQSTGRLSLNYRF